MQGLVMEQTLLVIRPSYGRAIAPLPPDSVSLSMDYLNFYQVAK